MTTRANSFLSVKLTNERSSSTSDVGRRSFGWRGVFAVALASAFGVLCTAPDAMAKDKDSKKRDVSEVPAGGGADTTGKEASKDTGKEADSGASKKAAPKRAVSNSPLDPYRDFGLTGEYKLYMNRTLQDRAKVYHSPIARAWLVLGTNYPGGKALLLDTKSRKIFTLPGDNFLKARNVLDTLAVRSDSKLEELGAMRFQAKKGTMGKSMGWSYEDKDKGMSLRMRPSGDFKGMAGADGLLRVAPQYRRDTASYKKVVYASQEEVKYLADLKALIAKLNPRSLTVEVYFGTWCPTCKQVMGKIMFLDREFPDVRFSYYGFSSIKEEYEKNPRWVKNKIIKMPTVIVRKSGKEIGRAHSNHWNRPVLTMLSELQKYERTLKSTAKSTKKPTSNR